MLHGNLLSIKCANGCGYFEEHNTLDPLCPALAAAAEDAPPGQLTSLLDPSIPAPAISSGDLPQCPDCRQRGKCALLRPGVVWFGEALPEGMLEEADDWVRRDKVDVMLVIGTSAAVYPAASYTSKAKKRGAVVAVINPDPNANSGLDGNDFFFQGDAAEFLPKLFESVIGDLKIPEQEPGPAA
jgi:NAD+-dependent protein deacetylase sirtuin 5